jgi:hypothetical protein
MAATLFDDSGELVAVEESLRGLGFHSLHPDIIKLYYGHLYKQRWNIEYCLACSPIRGKTYIFTESAVPESVCQPGFKIHSPLSLGKGEKYTEIVYPLDKLAEREHYGSKKSFYNSVRAPNKFMEKEDLSICLSAWIDKVEEYQALYKLWVDQKIARGVHLITFPVARYRRCINMVNEMDNLHVIELRRNETRELIAFRIVLIDKALKNAYDIVFVSNLEIPQLSNAFNYVGLELLKHCDVKTFNCGVSTGKLKAYKKQYPHYEKTVHLIGGENAG